jgi:hypothetical protein
VKDPFATLNVVKGSFTAFVPGPVPLPKVTVRRMPNRSRRWLVLAAVAAVLAAVAVFDGRGEQPNAACPPVEESGDVAPERTDLGPPYQGQGAVIAETVHDQAVPGTVGVAEDLPADWFGIGAVQENEPLLLCEYLLATDPPNGAMCSYDGVDLDLVAGRYRFVVLRSGSPGIVRAVFELRGAPGPTEVCPTTIDAARRHAPVVYPPLTSELTARLRPLVEGTG